MTGHEVYVLGVAIQPARVQEHGLRLEEMVYQTCRAALDDADVTRAQLDNVVLGASDELDGRPITNMLLTAPAGGFLKDEMRVTDSGASALCVGYARMRSGEFDLGLVSSWCKSSKIDSETVMSLRADPFYYRPLGMGARMADGLLAQAIAAGGASDAEVNARVHRAYARAQANPRGLQLAVRSQEAIASSAYVAAPLREWQAAPQSDGAVALVVASARFVAAHPGCKPLARITGAGWASDSYTLDAARLGGFRSAKMAWGRALKMAGANSASDFDVLELDSPTGWHEVAWVRAFGIEDESALSPSGGAFAQNPVFCNGLVNAAEAVLQIAGRAGPVQRPNVRRALAHGCHGFAQQGNVVVTFERAGS